MDANAVGEIRCNPPAKTDYSIDRSSQTQRTRSRLAVRTFSRFWARARVNQTRRTNEPSRTEQTQRRRTVPNLPRPAARSATAQANARRRCPAPPTASAASYTSTPEPQHDATRPGSERTTTREARLDAFSNLSRFVNLRTGPISAATAQGGRSEHRRRAAPGALASRRRCPRPSPNTAALREPEASTIQRRRGDCEGPLRPRGPLRLQADGEAPGAFRTELRRRPLTCEPCRDDSSPSSITPDSRLV